MHTQVYILLPNEFLHRAIRRHGNDHSISFMVIEEARWMPIIGKEDNAMWWAYTGEHSGASDSYIYACTITTRMDLKNTRSTQNPPHKTCILFIFAKTWKQLISSNRRRDKQMVIHARNEILFSVQKNETSSHKRHGGNFNACDSERSQSEKAVWFKYMTVWKGKSMKTVKRSVVCRGLGGCGAEGWQEEHRSETTLYDNYE